MKTFLSVLRLDLRLQTRNRVYAISVPMALVFALALRFLFDHDQAAPVLSVFYLLVVGASTYFFAAAMVLLEKNDGVFAALRASPLSPATYIGSKVVTLTALLLLEATVVYTVAFWGSAQLMWPMLLGLIMLAALQTLIGLGQVARHDAVTSFLVPGAALIAIVLQLPVCYVFGAGPAWFWYLWPTQGPLLLILASFQPLEPWQWAYALAVSAASMAWATWWALRRFERFMIWSLDRRLDVSPAAPVHGGLEDLGPEDLERSR